MSPDLVVSLSAWGTVAFSVSAVAAVVFPDTLAVPFLVISLSLFVLGCAAFFRALLLAARRSRRDEVDLAGLFLLSRSAPKGVKARLLGPLGVQILVALVTASVRPFSVLAFGVLVPTYGLGLCGFWAAKAGRFPRRTAPTRDTPDD